jgi:hypothetical protein
VADLVTTLLDEGHSIPEEIVGLSYYFLPQHRQEETARVLAQLQRDPRLEFLLAIFTVTVNDRPLNPAGTPDRTLLRKLLQALDREDGLHLLYASPYNEIGLSGRTRGPDRPEWWNFDIADGLHEFRELWTIRMFLEHGTGLHPGVGRKRADELHRELLHGLVAESRNFAVWGCNRFTTPGPESGEPAAVGEAVWPAREVSPWFRDVFWDDLLFVLNQAESTLIVLAVTSG